MIINQNSTEISPESVVTVQSNAELRSEAGTLWETQVVFENIGGNGIEYFAFTTGTNPVYVTRRVVGGSFEDVTYSIYKGAIVSGGNNVPVGNLSDINAQTTQGVLVSDPTISSEGTLWSPPYRILGDVVQGSSRASNVSYGEGHGVRALAPNTTYLVKIENNQNENITVLTVDISFYEET